MTTTDFISEILVAGLWASAWIMLLIYSLDSSLVHGLFSALSSGNVSGALSTVFVVAFCYQIGWIVSGFSYHILDYLFGRRIKAKLLADYGVEFSGDSLSKEKLWHRIKVSALSKSSDYFRSEIKQTRIIVRLSRTACLNFFCIGLSLLLHPTLRLYLVSSIVFLVISILCFFQWKFRYLRYYRQLLSIGLD